MPTKTPSIISVILSVILLLLLGVLSVFMTLVALNGFTDNEAGPALGTLGLCSITGIILSAILSGWLTKLFITKYNWNAILAVIVSIVASLILGGVIYFVAIILSVVVAQAVYPL